MKNIMNKLGVTVGIGLVAEMITALIYGIRHVLYMDKLGLSELKFTEYLREIFMEFLRGWPAIIIIVIAIVIVATIGYLLSKESSKNVKKK